MESEPKASASLAERITKLFAEVHALREQLQHRIEHQNDQRHVDPRWLLQNLRPLPTGEPSTALPEP